MKLCTFGLRGSNDRLLPGVIQLDTVIDISSVLETLPDPLTAGGLRYGPGDKLNRMFTPNGLTAISEFVDSGKGTKVYSLEAVRLGPPVPKPGKIVAAGRNYAAHMEEAMVIWRERGRKVVLPTTPTGFMKVPSAISGHDDEVTCPPQTKQMDYEVELAAVMGQYAKDVSVEEALDYVAGYTVMNDLSAREIQFAEMDQVGIMLGKNFPGFAAMGPCMVTKDEIPDPQDLMISCRVNGETRQHASTKGMVFSVAQIISHFSQMGLYPGDVIMTGSPEGIACSKRPDPTPYFLRPGTVIEVEAERIGVVRSRIV